MAFIDCEENLFEIDGVIVNEATPPLSHLLDWFAEISYQSRSDNTNMSDTKWKMTPPMIYFNDIYDLLA